MSNCKPGDLAIVVEAYNACNIGTIVHVIGLHPKQSGICAPEGDIIWKAEARHPMTYDINGVLRRRRLGPVPDSQLRPIKGKTSDVADKQPIDLITA